MLADHLASTPGDQAGRGPETAIPSLGGLGNPGTGEARLCQGPDLQQRRGGARGAATGGGGRLPEEEAREGDAYHPDPGDAR